jgi:hypothetical protein
MENDRTKVLGWGTIIAILVGVALVTGLLLGLMRSTLGLSTSMTGGGIGASVGVVGAILVARRQAAIARQNNR